MNVDVPMLNRKGGGFEHSNGSVKKYTLVDVLPEKLANLHLKASGGKMVDKDHDKKANFTITHISENDHQRALEFLRRSFFRDEPLNICVDLLPYEDSTCVELEQYCLETMKQDVSFMALDEHGDIIGICANAVIDLTKNHEEENFAEINACPNPKFKKILRLLSTVDMNANYRSKYPQVKSMGDVIILSVDDRYRGMGIAKKFLDHTIELMQSKDIPLLVMICTSAYSAKAAVRMGFDVIYQLKYEDYKDGGEEPVFKPVYPHTEVSVGAVVL